jgi:hypothetical protein
METNVFTFFISVTGPEAIYRGLPNLLNDLESTELVDCIFYSNHIIHNGRISALLRDMERDNLFRRLHIFHEWKDGLNVRLFHVLDRLQTYIAARQEYDIITPIFRVTPDNWHDLEHINNYEDNVLIARGSFSLIRSIIKKFADSPESVTFEEYEEQKKFYQMIGQEFMQLPFQFKVARL